MIVFVAKILIIFFIIGVIISVAKYLAEVIWWEALFQIIQQIFAYVLLLFITSMIIIFVLILPLKFIISFITGL